MKQYRFSDKKIWKVFFVLFVFLQLILVRDTMIAQCIVGVVPAMLLSLGLMLFLGLIFLLKNRRQWKEILLDGRMTVITLTAVILLIPMVVKRDWQMMYFTFLLCIWFAVFLTYFVSYREVGKIYVEILALLGVYSLIATYILEPLADANILNAPVFPNKGDHEFYNFIFAVSIKLPYPYYRNFGIFREPGVYQFFILLALVLNNYTVSWEKPWKMWMFNMILAVVMLSTISTGGVIELAILAVVIFFDKGYYRNKRVLLATIILLLAVFIAGAAYLSTNTALMKEVSDMLTKLWVITQSSSARYESIATDLFIFLKHPIFGDNLASVLYAVDDNTTSTLILYAMLGVAGGSLNVAAWVALVWEKERKIWVNIALLVILFMSFNTQNLTWDFFFWLFPVMALVERGIPLLKLEQHCRRE